MSIVSHPPGAEGHRPFIGRSIPRVEDQALLTGGASFVDDIVLPGELHAVFVRSHVAYGRIRRVDVEAARHVPGVAAAFTAEDFGVDRVIETPVAEGIYRPLRPVLAHQVVRFVGEPVALVVAASRYLAEDAAALVAVDIDPLPAITDLDAALAAGTPLLHPHSSNVVFESEIEVGDVDAAFASAAVELERTFVHPRSTASPMESRGAVATPDGDGGELLIWSSTQGPHNLRRLVAEVLELDIERVRVRCPDVGGGFGLKGVAYAEELLVAWAAHTLDSPVKWVEDRVENLLSATHAREMRVRVRAAADADGRLAAIEADILADTGAYGVYPQGHVLEAVGVMALLPGPYVLPAYRARTRSVVTNKCPSGPYRGVGLPVAAFVHERVMDMLARELAMDRAEFRRLNLVPADAMPFMSATNQRYDSGDYRKALQTGLEMIRYAEFAREQEQARAEGRLIGLGICCYVEWTGNNSKSFKGRGMTAILGFDGCHIALDDDGRATVWTTLPAMGQGTATTFAQAAADVLGFNFEDIRVVQSDTAVGQLEGTGTFASRSAILGHGAIGKAGSEVRRRLLEDAADRLEASVDDLELAGGSISVRGSPRHAVTVADLVAAGGTERYRASGQFDSEHVLYAYATHACRVEVDPETGELTILEYVVAEDCGRVVNHAIAEGQTHGAVAQGIAGTVYENFTYDENGQPQTASFMDYLVPTACEIPSVTTHHLELPVPDNPWGSKGIGEGGTIAPAGLLANAVADALGVECNTLPLSPARVQALALEAPCEPPVATLSTWPAE